MYFTDEHEAIRRNVRRFIDTEINPHLEEWKAAPAPFRRTSRSGRINF